MLKRVFELLLSLFLLVTLAFFLMKNLPGSPLNEEVTLNNLVLENLQKQWGHQESVFFQYQKFIIRLLQGEWGYSARFPDQPLLQRLAISWQQTMQLALPAFVISMLGAIVITLFSLRSQALKSWWREMQSFILSTPTLFWGPFLIWLFGFQFNFLPIAFLESPLHYVLPLGLLSMRPMASVSRLLQQRLEGELHRDYVRTARAKGLESKHILRKHILKNAFIPVLAFLPNVLMSLLGGSFLIEILFAISGVGTEFVQAIMERDSLVVVFITLTLGFFWIVVSWGVDLLMTKLDPRIQL